MIGRALLAALGFLSFCFFVAAQQTNPTNQFNVPAALALYPPEIFRTVDSSALMQDLPMLTLLSERLPGSTGLGRMGWVPLDISPVAFATIKERPKTNASPVAGLVDGKDLAGEVISSPLNPIYYGGEVGVLYGRSTGKLGGDLFQTYILGQVGDEKVHITVGAAYEESSGRLPRWPR